MLLINPPAWGTVQGNNPSFIDRERGFNPPLGLLYVASAAQAEGHRIEVVDCQAEQIGYRKLGRVLVSRTPDVVGIHAMTLTLPDVIRTASMVKTILPAVPVVLGGPHTIFYQAETLSHSSIDILVRGEGENTFTHLLEHLQNNVDLSSVRGISFKHRGKIVTTPDQELCSDLNSLPFPARKLTPVARYRSVIARHSPITTMVTSRGCPYRCTFCSRPHLGKEFRARSAANVVDEMEVCRKLGIPEILIYDDTFTVQPDRVADICREIRRRKLDVTFDIRARVDTISASMLHDLKQAGCDRIHYGVEAGNDRMMEAIGKSITVAQAKKAFEMTRETGISTLAYFMVGLPGQKQADLDDTWELIKRINPDYLHLTMLSPFPGSAVFAQGIKQGIFTDFWRDFVLKPEPGYQTPYWKEHLSREDLLQFMAAVYRKFYMTPRRVIREMGNIRRLPSKIKAGLSMLMNPN